MMVPLALRVPSADRTLHAMIKKQKNKKTLPLFFSCCVTLGKNLTFSESPIL